MPGRRLERALEAVEEEFQEGLFTQVPSREILGSPDAASCITSPNTPVRGGLAPGSHARTAGSTSFCMKTRAEGGRRGHAPVSDGRGPTAPFLVAIALFWFLLSGCAGEASR